MKNLNYIYKSKLSRYKNIENRNKAFDALDEPTKKREIAFDALKLLIDGIMKPSNGAYFRSGYTDFLNQYNDSKHLQKCLININLTNSCRVCARGALLTSRIRLGNKINPANVKIGALNNLLSGELTSNEENVFSRRELNHMEKEYERGTTLFKQNTKINLMNILLNIIYNGEYVINQASLKHFDEFGHDYNTAPTTDYLKVLNLDRNKYE